MTVKSSFGVTYVAGKEPKRRVQLVYEYFHLLENRNVVPNLIVPNFDLLGPFENFVLIEGECHIESGHFVPPSNHQLAILLNLVRFEVVQRNGVFNEHLLAFCVLQVNNQGQRIVTHFKLEGAILGELRVGTLINWWNVYLVDSLVERHLCFSILGQIFGIDQSDSQGARRDHIGLVSFGKRQISFSFLFFLVRINYIFLEFTFALNQLVFRVEVVQNKLLQVDPPVSVFVALDEKFLQNL